MRSTISSSRTDTVMRWFVLPFLVLGFVLAKHEEYDGHALFTLKVQNADQTQYVNSFGAPIDVWSHAFPGRDGMVLVPKYYIEKFQQELRAKGIEYTIEVQNIKESLDLEDELLAKAARKPSSKSNRLSLDFDRIYNLTEIYNYLDNIAAAYPNVVTLVNAGTSFEGRDIKYLRISTTNFQVASKPIIFVESLIHSREWVTLPATLYAIEKLVVDVTEADLINDYDWIIMPVVNPDGYEFTHTSNRFWRKNRRNGVFPGDFCMGVDLNRNFDAFFGVASSNNACMDDFHGSYGFSEPETRVVRDILSEYSSRIELFLDIHSFGSFILYGFGTGQLPPNAFALQVGGIQMATAIDAVKVAHNPDYIVGNAAMILYPASGTTMDYGLVAGVPLSYTYEMPAARGFGNSLLGFLVDPDFIEQAGRETWEGIKTGARFARSLMAARS